MLVKIRYIEDEVHKLKSFDGGGGSNSVSGSGSRGLLDPDPGSQTDIKC